MSDRRPRGRARTSLAAFPALALAALLALALAGCSQEGKLIQNQLPVLAVAADFVPLFNPADSSITENVRLKVLVHVQNACEAQHTILALRQYGTAPIIYQVTPMARYNADDKCVMDVSGPRDTVFTLNVNGLGMGKAFGATIDSTLNSRYTFAVQVPGAPSIVLVVDSLVTDPVTGTARFNVRVEDATSGTVVPGAEVAIDELGAGGSATPLDSLLTDAQGLATLTVVAPADTAGAPNLPYRARVVSGVKQSVFSVPSYPARYLRREKIVIRI